MTADVPPREIRPRDLAREADQVTSIDPSQLPPLPPPYTDWRDEPIAPLSASANARWEHSLDGVVGLRIARPDTAADREAYVMRFLVGVQKLLDRENNWTFLQPLLLSLENCVKCNSCADACPVYESSGRNDVYRPLLRGEILRRVAARRKGGLGRLLGRLNGNDVDVTWDLLARLADLSYRCTLCRRCAQSCAMGVDNGLITRELRKLFSQELDWSPVELHGDGTVKQLAAGSSTGMNPKGFLDIVEFAQDDIKDRLGIDVEIPVDRGAPRSWSCTTRANS